MKDGIVEGLDMSFEDAMKHLSNPDTSNVGNTLTFGHPIKDEVTIGSLYPVTLTFNKDTSHPEWYIIPIDVLQTILKDWKTSIYASAEVFELPTDNVILNTKEITIKG